MGERLPVYAENLAEREALLRRTWERLDPQFRTPNQVLGRRSTIGCVALEITQRCNLDCTLCYLSESSEAVKDLPLDAVFERIDRIRETYGPGIGVQVTGGDPTLRPRDELVAIVRRLAERGLRPSLFTNGIRATRDLLEELAAAGLFDVAFHVDTTQRFKKYPNEESLNAVRREYIERARGLAIAVIFNTTVHAGNLEEVPMLVRFFLEHSDVVGMASFQVQAATGRGEWRERSPHVTSEAIRERIRRGVGLPRLAWDTALVGHPKCNRGTMLATVGGRAIDVLSDPPLYERFLHEFRHVSFDRRDVQRTARRVLASAFRNPYWLVRGGAFLARKLWSARSELWRRERMGKITLFVHDFMDAAALDPERIRNCAFMIMTAEGPVSMCEHNARRDDYILRPLPIRARGGAVFDPTTGGLGERRTASS
jgi:7,8-dihydro-6-hydroxymethylpterin dimethyltransferase